MRNRKGFTIAELTVGVACAAVISLVSAGLFKAGVSTYNYTIRQNSVLIAAANSLSGDGSRLGILSSTRQAKDVGSLSATTLVLVSTAGATTTFALSGENLNRTENSLTTQLATGISTVTYRYYNLNPSTGLIMESTAAVSAAMVTANLVVKGKYATQRNYLFYGAARLRNHQ